MSAQQVVPETRPTTRPRLVPSRPHAVGNVGFAAIVLTLLAVGMFGLLVLQTRIQDQGFQLSRLGYQADSLVEREAALRTQLDAVSSPAELMRQASAMGMVPAGRPGYLMLATGAIDGDATAATGRDLRNLRTADQQVAEAKAKADADAKAKAEAEAQRREEERRRAEAAAQASAQPAAAPGGPSAEPTPAAQPTAQASVGADPSAAPEPDARPESAAPTAVGQPASQPAAQPSAAGTVAAADAQTTTAQPTPTKRGR